MTKTEILAMPAGRALSELVHQIVMELPGPCQCIHNPDGHNFDSVTGQCLRCHFYRSKAYSTDIKYALDVLCKVRKGAPFMITAGLADGSDQYEGKYYCSVLDAEGFGDTISHAICRAALSLKLGRRVGSAEGRTRRHELDVRASVEGRHASDQGMAG